VPHQSQLATLFFALGIVALLWVFRRTLLRSRGPGLRDANAFATRRLTAEAEIDEISAREWLSKWRNALKFERLSPISSQQQLQLDQITQWQLAQRRAAGK
jgi:hypothetical protein